MDIEDTESHELREGFWHRDPTPEGLLPIRCQGTNSTKDAKKIKDDFCSYFNSPNGQVEWQRRIVGLED